MALRTVAMLAMRSHPRYEHDADIVECANCDREFDLARQPYYGPLCPRCRGGSL